LPDWRLRKNDLTLAFREFRTCSDGHIKRCVQCEQVKTLWK
jgi:hypothetical protein